jgi:hypothetical protein
MKGKSQLKQILEALENGEVLTQKEAYERFNCTRLAARINDLQKLGHTIQTVKESGEGTSGQSKYWI